MKKIKCRSTEFYLTTKNYIKKVMWTIGTINYYNNLLNNWLLHEIWSNLTNINSLSQFME